MTNPLPPTAPLVYKAGTTLEERERMRSEQMRKSQKALVDTFTWECCYNCEHWNNREGFEICEKYNMRPPILVITIGCTDFSAGIPF
jgi:hypothetical protein